MTDHLSAEDLAELERLSSQGMDGPFQVYPLEKRDTRPVDCYDVLGGDTYPIVANLTYEDAAKISAALNALPRLLATVQRVKALAGRLIHRGDHGRDDDDYSTGLSDGLRDAGYEIRAALVGDDNDGPAT